MVLFSLFVFVVDNYLRIKLEAISNNNYSRVWDILFSDYLPTLRKVKKGEAMEKREHYDSRYRRL